MKIKQSVINTFNRCSVPYEELLSDTTPHEVRNRFTGETVVTTALIAWLIRWVYQTNNEYERDLYITNVSDFDRIRYFVLDQDSHAYMNCLD